MSVPTPSQQSGKWTPNVLFYSVLLPAYWGNKTNSTDRYAMDLSHYSFCISLRQNLSKALHRGMSLQYLLKECLML